MRELEQVEIKHATAGGHRRLTGFEEVYIGDADRSRGTGANCNSWISIRRRFACTFWSTIRPFAGREGKLSRHVIFVNGSFAKRAAMSRSKSTTRTRPAAFEINARGEMQIAILVEQIGAKAMK